MNNRFDAGISRVEILVGLVIFGVVIFVGGPAFFDVIASSHDLSGVQLLSNAKQLYIVTRQMADDGEASGDKSLGWPGDTGSTFTNWQKQLVPAYLGTNDFCKLLSSVGVTVSPSKFPLKAMSEGALIVYAVSSNSAPETVHFSSANFTNSPTGGSSLLKTAKPWGKRKFVVFRKGGDGAVLVGKDVGNTSRIGSYASPVR